MNQVTEPTHLREPVATPAGSGRSRAMRAARRHSSHVRLLKFALPVAALALVAIFVGQSWIASNPIEGVAVEGTAIEDGRLVMTNPSIEGYTGDDAPYSVTARRAIQAIGDDQYVDLEGIDADLPLNDGRRVHIRAEDGQMDRHSNMLNIKSAMQVTASDGMSAQLQSASIDMANGQLSTDQQVDISMDGTQISADRMQILDNGTRIVFESRVRVEIDARQLQTAAREGGPGDEN